MHAADQPGTLSSSQRARFDALLEEAIDALPDDVRTLLDEVPVIVDDAPDAALAATLAQEWGEVDSEAWREQLADELAGLHTGVMLTERSVEMPTSVPEDIRLFRRGVVRLSEAALDDADADGEHLDPDDALYEQIWITLVHEIGHHFGLSEDDLERLGYA